MSFSTLLIAALFSSAIAAPLAAPLAASSSLENGVPLSIWGGQSCNSQGVSVSYIPIDGTCFGTSPIFSGNTDSFQITADNIPALPSGCKVIAYDTDGCQGNQITIDQVGGDCKSFGSFAPIRSAQAVGCN
ncbi:hypothetical protein COCC4DRAFT_172989 [Bipolaris maydis ATCC 48331]|uniref:Uncharacterized protein n=2 Tax=Cochliobolus heterostrophus TaxID=5016 RepID=M2UIR7_COCH5|nr:uncharacterized protein COCC4DRAFT_172989 [Bipolaris maydis ATCC 48331]EMD87822.1 hypothetical protein COCHEDRAFT_1143412 [Bipolaris maydis C5]KAH7552080.1 hypothetical protein BM1_08942 [Bipolaris maydis]ENI03336.1 hypothetical protein COCC4DRAFT_172989 [Bipolaris maydis ATCC 48331]KAJ5020392.1 hypothetical protein J3E73DRAFT_222330 [Bipolaris maydis]KAJ5020444.1 hypothetical protein J3E73DRAFT_222245 [Bipolaris maydis]